MWKSIVFNISKTAKETIPHKQIPYRRPRKPLKLLDIRPTGLLAHHVSLRKIIRDIEYNPDPSYFSNMEFLNFNSRIDDINTAMELTIPHIDPVDLAIWISTGKHYLSLIKKIIKLETLKAKEEAIT
jgi:hypothetical protein